MLENIQTIIIWIIIGSWISYKRNWYDKHRGDDDLPQEILILVTVVFAPIALCFAIFERLILKKWSDND